jgi:hypothetical protein
LSCSFAGRELLCSGIFILQEILFWLFAALITSACLYYADYGAVTVRGMIGFTLGAFLWYNIRKHIQNRN